jgi:RES domain-containing protein
MGLKSPSADLGKRRLRLVRVPEILVRISRAGYRDPFFWSRLGRNRFDLPDGRYGVLYTAQDLETCVLEVFGDRWLKERVLTVAALSKFEVLTFAVRRAMQVADLTGPALNRLGTDANVFASNDYAVTQEWSRQLMTHAQARDGIRYHSRKNPRKNNYAIYDTTLAKESIQVLERRRLGEFLELYTILDNYEVALIG